MVRDGRIRAARSEAGFTLVEALVALLVLAIGMLGIASLYVESLQAGRTALVRTMAINLASDMADRIRANRGGGAAFENAGAAACDPALGPATPDVLATNETACWHDSVAADLPNGDGTVAVDVATTPTTYVITVSWGEVGQADAATYVLRLQT
jgi:type IV pilus assembly protein PilV